MSWRPIETAPRDGSRLLLWHPTLNLAISGCWHSEPERNDPSGYAPAWAWWVSDADLIIWDSGPEDVPSHWMPLEVPPNADT